MRTVAYGRHFAVCQACEFPFCHDYPELLANVGMGMVGSWGGPERGGEREDFLVRLLRREFGVEKHLLFGVGSALAFRVLTDEGFNVHGCDVSADVVAYRRREFGERFFDARFLESNSELYGAIVACEVFEHLHRPAQWVRTLATHLLPGGIICGTTNFYPGGPVEDGSKVGYMRSIGHVAYWSERAMAIALQPFGMKVVAFEMICPGSVKPDLKYNELFLNKRVFFATSDDSKMERLREIKRLNPILPLDVSAYPHPAYLGHAVSAVDPNELNQTAR